MTAIHVDTRSFRLRFPALVVGRLGTAVVVQVTEHVELRIERRGPRRVARGSAVAAVARAEAELDAHRTRAVGARLGGL